MFDDAKRKLFKRSLQSVRWLSYARRRYGSRFLYNEVVGFPDSDLALGEERIAPNENEYIERMLEILRVRHQRDFPPGVRPMTRDFHGKNHGTVAAEFRVEADLPAEARYGIFSEPKELLAVVRFSNGSRDIGADRLPNQRGMAIKLLEDGKPDRDLILSTVPVNFMRDVEDAYYFYRADAASRPLAYFLRNPDKFALTLLWTVLEPETDLFNLTYFSQTPYRLGPTRACKYIAKPVEPKPSPGPDDSANQLRDQMAKRFGELEPDQFIRFDFHVQPQRHPIRQPIEDHCFEWDQTEARPIKVATLTLRHDLGLPFTSPEAQWHPERLAFNPQNAEPHNRPIGGLNRARKAVYDEFAKMRFDANGVTQLKGRLALPPEHPNRPAEPKTEAARGSAPPEAVATPSGAPAQSNGPTSTTSPRS